MTVFDPQLELEANEFAMALLMPYSFLQKDVAKHLGRDGQLRPECVAILAKKYKVTESLMRYRLIDLGYLEPL